MQVAGARLHGWHAACTFGPLVSASGRECSAAVELELVGLGLEWPATLGGVIDALLPPDAALTSLALTSNWPRSSNTLALPPALIAGCGTLAGVQSLRVSHASIAAIEALVPQAPHLTALHLQSSGGWYQPVELLDVPLCIRALGQLRSLQLMCYRLRELSPGPYLLGALAGAAGRRRCCGRRSAAVPAASGRPRQSPLLSGLPSIAACPTPLPSRPGSTAH